MNILKKIDPFVVLIILVIIFARMFPELGIERDWVHPSAVTKWGVMIIFFFYGLKLNRAKVVEGISNYRLHILIQVMTFVVFPLIIWPFMPHKPDALWLGIFFVAALPSTVSTSVVMVSIARGNVPAAIFNSSISSLLGVVLTPALMGLYLRSDVGAEPIEIVVGKLLLQVVLPITLGMVMNRWWGKWAEKHKVGLRWFDQIVILTIVWSAFCEGYHNKIFSAVGFDELIKLMAGMLALFVVSFGLIYLACRWLKFSREDKITATFCGSKKSLIHGSAMIKILITDLKLIGVMLLPLMLFHVIQLVLVSILSSYLNHQDDKRIEREKAKQRA